MALLPTIRRERLIDELSDPALRLVKFVAPAGYGKSTLARSLLDRRATVAVADLARVTSELDLEWRRSEYAAQSVAFGTDISGWLLLAAYAACLLDNATLLIENAEAVLARRSIADALEALVPRLPASTALIVCSRVEPELRFGRFCLTGAHTLSRCG